MTNTATIKTERAADLVVNELIRLEVSTEDDPCSGLFADATTNVVDEAPLVSIYDDHVRGFYRLAVLDFLKGLEPEDVSLDGESDKNIWQLISEFEV